MNQEINMTGKNYSVLETDHNTCKTIIIDEQFNCCCHSDCHYSCSNSGDCCNWGIFGKIDIWCEESLSSSSSESSLSSSSESSLSSSSENILSVQKRTILPMSNNVYRDTVQYADSNGTLCKHIIIDEKSTCLCNNGRQCDVFMRGYLDLRRMDTSESSCSNSWESSSSEYPAYQYVEEEDRYPNYGTDDAHCWHPSEEDSSSEFYSSSMQSPSGIYIGIQEGANKETRNKRVLVVKGETIKMGLVENFLDEAPDKFCPLVEWFISQISARGKRSSWAKIGEGPVLYYETNIAGIFNVKAVVTEYDWEELTYEGEYRRREDDYWGGTVMKLKKGEPACFGVVSHIEQKYLVLQAASELGNPVFAKEYPKDETGKYMVDEVRKQLIDKLEENGVSRVLKKDKNKRWVPHDNYYNNSYKCNLFIFIQANSIRNENGEKMMKIPTIKFSDLGPGLKPDNSSSSSPGSKLWFVAPLVATWNSKKMIGKWEIFQSCFEDSSLGDHGWRLPEPGWLVFTDEHCGILDYDGAWINGTNEEYHDSHENCGKIIGVGRNHYLSEDIMNFAKYSF